MSWLGFLANALTGLAIYVATYTVRDWRLIVVITSLICAAHILAWEEGRHARRR